VRVRLTRLPRPGELDEFDLRLYSVGEVYDFPPNLASILLIGGYAELAPAVTRSAAADQKRGKAGKLPEPEY
jgi:hypothetical protein